MTHTSSVLSLLYIRVRLYVTAVIEHRATVRDITVTFLRFVP